MQMREKLAYAFLLHFSALMIVFLLAGVVQLLLGSYLDVQLHNPVISAMVSLARVNLSYPIDKILIGIITFVFFIPLDISILYTVTRELFEKDDIYSGIEEGISLYPLFLVFISDMYFFSFTYAFFAPVVLYIILRYLEPKVPRKIHILSTILIGSWFVPISLVGKIPSIVVRNTVSFVLYLALVLPFFVHSWMISTEIKQAEEKKKEKKVRKKRSTRVH